MGRWLGGCTSAQRISVCLPTGYASLKCSSKAPFPCRLLQHHLPQRAHQQRQDLQRAAGHAGGPLGGVLRPAEVGRVVVVLLCVFGGVGASGVLQLMATAVFAVA